LHIGGIGTADGQQVTIEDGTHSLTLTYKDSPANDTEFNFTIFPYGNYFLADVINRRRIAGDTLITATYDGNVTINLSGGQVNTPIVTNVGALTVNFGMSGYAPPIQRWQIASDGAAVFADGQTTVANDGSVLCQSVNAGSYSVGGVAGFSGTFKAKDDSNNDVTITIVNGIVTNVA
jgi:hypothetical protein